MGDFRFAHWSKWESEHASKHRCHLGFRKWDRVVVSWTLRKFHKLKCAARLSINADNMVFRGFDRDFPQASKVWERGIMNFYLISIEVREMHSSLLRGLQRNSCRSSIKSFLAPTKLVALSDQIDWDFPLRLINLFRWIDGVERSSTTSKCVALVTKQTKIAMLHFVGGLFLTLNKKAHKSQLQRWQVGVSAEHVPLGAANWCTLLVCALFWSI